MEWFSRFADIPGVDYRPLAQVDRDSLLGHDVVPSPFAPEAGGDGPLWWGSGEGASAGSPTSRHAAAHLLDGDAVSAVRTAIAEALELPGTLSDYCFVLEKGRHTLWTCRAQDPQVPAQVEELSWTIVRTLEARPDLVALDSEGPDRSCYVHTIQRLIDLQVREGNLREAMDVARRVAAYDEVRGAVEKLQGRLEALDAEEVQG